MINIASPHARQRGGNVYNHRTITPSFEQFTRLAILHHSALDYMSGLDNRTCFYLDDLNKEQQQAILDIVNRLKQAFSSGGK